MRPRHVARRHRHRSWVSAHTVAVRGGRRVVAAGGRSSAVCAVEDWQDVTAVAARSYHTVVSPLRAESSPRETTVADNATWAAGACNRNGPRFDSHSGPIGLAPPCGPTPRGCGPGLGTWAASGRCSTEGFEAESSPCHESKEKQERHVAEHELPFAAAEPRRHRTGHEQHEPRRGERD